ncbi:MAG: hypothetical protein R3C11_19395 [Planctomycetaceae bacterium]
MQLQHTIGHVLMDVQQAGATSFNFSCQYRDSQPGQALLGGQLVPLHNSEGFDYTFQFAAQWDPLFDSGKTAHVNYSFRRLPNTIILRQ